MIGKQLLGKTRFAFLVLWKISVAYWKNLLDGYHHFPARDLSVWEPLSSRHAVVISRTAVGSNHEDLEEDVFRRENLLFTS